MRLNTDLMTAQFIKKILEDRYILNLKLFIYIVCRKTQYTRNKRYPALSAIKQLFVLTNTIEL